jgi:hypothetical protein
VVPVYSKNKKNKVEIIFKGKLCIIDFKSLETPTDSKGSEKLGAQTITLIRSAKEKNISVNGKTFKVKYFNSPLEIVNTVKIGVENHRKIPQDLKSLLLAYLNQRYFNKFIWMYYDNEPLKKEIAKYFISEIMFGLCVMNGDNAIIGSNPFKGKTVKEFAIPVDSKTAGIDSIFTLSDDSMVIISSKSGIGASSSFHTNIIPDLSLTNPSSKILKYMVDIYRRNTKSAIHFIYDVGINFLMGKYLRGNLGNKIKGNPSSVYQNLRTNNITDQERYLFDIVKNPNIKWPVMKNHSAIIKNLPKSFTYFICQNIANIMNDNKLVMSEIMKVLKSKSFYQSNLKLNDFVEKGIISFKLVYSGFAKVTITPGKGGMDSITSDYGRLTYILR